MNKATLQQNVRRGAHSFLIILTGAIAVLGCTWYLMTEHSVRFNGYRTGRGFYRLPPLPIMYDKETGKQYSVMDLEESYDNEDWESTSDEEPAPRPADTVWDRARTTIEENDVEGAKKLLQQFLDLTDLPINTYGEDESVLQAKRNAALDMLDAMTALRQGSRQQSAGDYLNARLALNEGTEFQPPEAADKNLRDNWDYLQAAKLYISKDVENARGAFSDHLKKYPNSEKNEAAMYMVAKITMESSHSFENTACGVQGKGMWDEPVDPAKVEAPEKCRDESWQSAINAFQLLMKKYPSGRYFDDSRGWLAYLHRRGANRAEALAEYYRMLGHPSDWGLRIEAKKSLQMLGHEYDDETLDRVEKLIEDEPDAAMAYAYHRIYNHAIDLSYTEREPWCCSGEDGWQQEYDEKKRVTEANEAGNHELERVARFATSMMKRHSRANVSGGFVLRVAEAQLELQNFKESLELAKKALGLGVQGELRTEALWVKGSSEHRLKDLTAARKSLEQLVSEFPKSKHNEGAHRLLSMIAEDRGDLESALDSYIALSYGYDVAYYVDVFLPTDRLAKYIAARPGTALHNELLYGLAVRYMRENRWNKARAALVKVRTEPTPPRDDYDDSSRLRSTKDPFWGKSESHVVSNDWVMLDLKTIDSLEHMEIAVANAPDDEAKAEAMYQQASFYFAADDLLLYNPAAWKGMRADLLDGLQFVKGMRFPEESQLIFSHSQEHDTFARAIPIYLEIVNRFPNTRAAKDALYSAAVAHQKLSSINDYWRAAYERNLYAGPRLVSYDDVKSAYPRYQLPRGTNGWAPATRTVNGGPGWAAPLKPAPRETKEHRVKRLLREAASTVADYSNKVLPKVESKVDAGIDWYKSAIEAAIYGIVSGIGLWFLVLIGIGLHSRLRLPGEVTKIDEPPGADSRVDKFLN